VARAAEHGLGRDELEALLHRAPRRDPSPLELREIGDRMLSPTATRPNKNSAMSKHSAATSSSGDDNTKHGFKPRSPASAPPSRQPTKNSPNSQRSPTGSPKPPTALPPIPAADETAASTLARAITRRAKASNSD